MIETSVAELKMWATHLSHTGNKKVTVPNKSHDSNESLAAGLIFLTQGFVLGADLFFFYFILYTVHAPIYSSSHIGPQ